MATVTRLILWGVNIVTIEQAKRLTVGESYGYAMRKNGKLIDDDGNATLFPADVAEWAYINIDELAMIACELQETPDAIE